MTVTNLNTTTDNVPAFKTCDTVHDHELETEDSMKLTTESQKIAADIQSQTISEQSAQFT